MIIRYVLNDLQILPASIIKNREEHIYKASINLVDLIYYLIKLRLVVLSQVLCDLLEEIWVRVLLQQHLVRAHLFNTINGQGTRPQEIVI